MVELPFFLFIYKTKEYDFILSQALKIIKNSHQVKWFAFKLLSTDWSKLITRPPILNLAGAKERKRSFHPANTMNLLLGIHLLLVKEENADRIWILFNLTHSVLTPGCQGGAPTHCWTFLQVTLSCWSCSLWKPIAELIWCLRQLLLGFPQGWAEGKTQVMAASLLLRLGENVRSLSRKFFMHNLSL